MSQKKAQVIAYYLPQYHPIPENDDWWGKGFTEWTNVGKARPLFKGHYQPKVPADLGYYDLRIPEIREAQAKMAKEAGVFGFCYWHYWFGNGKRLLDRPFNEVLESGKPDFPFCLGWANESWKAKSWSSDASKDKMLIEQTYPGERDYEEHFYANLKAFKDNRYIKIGKKPLFLIYQPQQIPDAKKFINLWNKLAKKNGFEEGIFFVARIFNEKEINELSDDGFNAFTSDRIRGVENKYPAIINKVVRKVRSTLNIPTVYSYKKAIKYFTDEKIDSLPNFFPSIIPNWDHTPRSKDKGLVLHKSSPQLFRKHLSKTFSIVEKKEKESQIVFLKSWNEWAEGNYMEPDLVNGHGYLNALKEELSK